MALLTWSSKYLTGIDAIDRDHQALFDAINNLQASISGDADAADVGETLSMLVDYVDSHFAREEELMQSCDYPDLVEHMRIHRKISHQVHDYQTVFEENGEIVDMREFVSFLGDWLKGHIAISDADYIPFVKSAGNKS
ncbi:MAG: hemerythrin family protein [Rhodospirillaceae bacterium]|jgi:hemerythrin|nr:hemerythrin family protein [Rhodospirillaceae bacterium]